MAENKKAEEKLKVIIQDLQSKDDKRVLKGIKALKVNGKDEVIPMVLEVWNDGVSEKIEKEIIELLYEIKSTSSAPYFMEAVANKDFEKIHLQLLQTIWNSKVDYSEYLMDFVSIAIAKDFLHALECITIIENLEGPFEEHHLLDAEMNLREYVETQKNNPTDEQQKFQLVLEIAKIINQMEESDFDGEF